MERKDHHQDANDDDDLELFNLREELKRSVENIFDKAQKLHEIHMKEKKKDGVDVADEKGKDAFKKLMERKMEFDKLGQRIKANFDVDFKESEEKSQEPEPEHDKDKKSRERKMEPKKSEERMKAILDVDSKESEEKNQEYSKSAYNEHFPVLKLKMGNGSEEKRSKEDKGYYQVQIHFDESLDKQVKQFSRVLIDAKYIPHVGLVRGSSLDINKLRFPLNRFAFVWTKKIPLSFNAIGWPKPQPNDITVYLNAIPDPVLYDLQAELIRLIEKEKCVLDVDYHGDKWFPECPIAARLSNDDVIRVYEAVAPKLPLIGHARELAVVKYTESEDGGQRRLTCEKLYSTAFIGIPR